MSKELKWFKHYNRASEGQSFELLLAEKDYETAFLYWWLLEQVSKFEDSSNDQNRGRITLNFSYFKRKLFMNFQKTSRLLDKIAKTFDLEIVQNSDESISVFVPKWLELQENRGGKREAKIEQSSVKNREEVRIKNKEYIKPAAHSFDFLSLYELYPRHEGKTRGLQTCKVQIKTQADFDALKTAIVRYKQHCAFQRTDLKFIKQFSAFMNCWRDYLDKSFGAAPPKRNLQHEQHIRDRAELESGSRSDLGLTKALEDENTKKAYEKLTRKFKSLTDPDLPK